MDTSRSRTALSASVSTRTRASDADRARAADAAAFSAAALLLGDAATLFDEPSDAASGRPLERRAPSFKASAASRCASAKTNASGDDVAFAPSNGACAARPAEFGACGDAGGGAEALLPAAAAPPEARDLSGDDTADTECTGLRVDGTCVTRTPIVEPEMTRDSSWDGDEMAGARAGRVGDVDGGRIILGVERNAPSRRSRARGVSLEVSSTENPFACVHVVSGTNTRRAKTRVVAAQDQPGAR
jgi:hypothetical protein